MTDEGIDEGRPLLQQLAQLRPAEYQTWLLRTSRGKARFFESSRLESLTMIKWWVVPLLWLPVAVLLAAQASRALPPRALAGAVAAGVPLWQLIEYSMHRWLFHAAPATPLAIIAHFLMHGNHHKYPSDIDRLVFPPLPACLPAAVIYGCLRCCLPRALAAAVFSGVLLGYVAYDCMHYLMHSGHLRGRLRARHMHHHYADDRVAYGISSPLWDVVFGTQPRTKTAKSVE
ncbi:fatty acid 2-hydroxylase 2-like [Micractinium conductrix]|uniref:Fatty acid 2-hydroxylase 2-like n=1 Tax=Micractinium conductrix TaxID=554055 RepID=A0A2P6VGP9_9CHLO|nr:fatty acid 2-hydroxylase 2-like [Micractinium conductrix]|eukprot:PSC73265.1 fatty acid 2-hydroxylase 2-like [Micractinium conductrix]